MEEVIEKLKESVNNMTVKECYERLNYLYDKKHAITRELLLTFYDHIEINLIIMKIGK